jgi:hypothetical protein
MIVTIENRFSQSAQTHKKIKFSEEDISEIQDDLIHVSRDISDIHYDSICLCRDGEIYDVSFIESDGDKSILKRHT